MALPRFTAWASHLHHPDTAQLIGRDMQKGLAMDAALREYAETAARFAIR